MGCSGKCDDCKPSDQPKLKIKLSSVSDHQDASDLLKPTPPEIKADSTDLSEACGHYQYSFVPRYQCEHCIKSWVEANSLEEVQKTVDNLVKNGKKIAADRVEQALKRKHWKQRLI